VALKVWQIALLTGAACGAVFATLSIAVGIVYAVFFPVVILFAVRDASYSRG
jgi:hypothetical protein